MNKLLSSAAVAAVLLCATPVSAQVAPAGARVEALVGYDRVKSSGETFGGIFGGLGAGYDVAVANNFSLGADVEATLATTDEVFSGVTVRAGRDLYAGGRASFGLAPSLIGYIKGGYTNARVKAVGFGVGENVDGWRAGAGLQYLLGGASYVGGEYRYSNYEGDFERHQLALTLGTRFGAAPAPAPAPYIEAPVPATAPATQTCADGSVILATQLCPAPAPAPIPAPAQAGERG